MWGLGVCMSLFVALHAVLVYQETLSALNAAYDRSLLASAKTIGESLELRGGASDSQIVAQVPYAALEAFEADSRTRMTYRVTDARGGLVSGYPDMQLSPLSKPEGHGYAALVEFFDANYDGRDVRVARLMQPLSNAATAAMAQIDVAETLELRLSLARNALRQAVGHHALMLMLMYAVVFAVVHRATSGVRRIGRQIEARDPQDLSPVDVREAPRELRPALEAANRMLSALHDVGERQKRFVRDAAHQLRTPLAVLKVQAQSTLRGDVEPMQGLREINATIDRATHVANQMLALAQVEQMRLVAARDGTPVQAFDAVVRDVALALAPLIAQRDIEFDIDTDAAQVRAHDWMLSELTRNLLANAIRFTPEGGLLVVMLVNDGDCAVLSIADSGPGMAADQRDGLFVPFSGKSTEVSEHAGAGLGLVICQDICKAIGATFTLDNAFPSGLVASVRVPLANGRTHALALGRGLSPDTAEPVGMDGAAKPARSGPSRPSVAKS